MRSNQQKAERFENYLQQTSRVNEQEDNKPAWTEDTQENLEIALATLEENN